jgi:hypothetical protein
VGDQSAHSDSFFEFRVRWELAFQAQGCKNPEKEAGAVQQKQAILIQYNNEEQGKKTRWNTVSTVLSFKTIESAR